MSICVFKTKELKRCITHALNSTQWRMGFADSAVPWPGLFVVHDQGVYLMSNGEPGDALKDELGVYVAYAAGCDPDNDANWWEVSRALVGGDDFAEVIPIKENWEKECDNFEEFHVRVTPNEISTRFDKPKGAVAV